MTSRAYRLIRKVDETPNTISVYLSSADEAPLPPFNGGQFLRFPNPRCRRARLCLVGILGKSKNLPHHGQAPSGR